MVCTKGKQVVITLALAAALLLGAGSAVAQEGQREGRRGGRDFANMSEEQREQFRQRMAERMEQRRAEQAERMQAELAVSDEEFAAILPMIERIRQLTRERGMALRPRNEGRGGPGGPGGGRQGGFRGFEPEQAELSPQAKQLEEAADKLRASVTSKASEQEVQRNLAAFRAARDQMEQAIATARQELTGVLLPRQEAVLVVAGVLE